MLASSGGGAGQGTDRQWSFDYVILTEGIPTDNLSSRKLKKGSDLHVFNQRRGYSLRHFVVSDSRQGNVGRFDPGPCRAFEGAGPSRQARAVRSVYRLSRRDGHY
ncbi:hypothetical protein D3C73_1370370 [compost metagenome]